LNHRVNRKNKHNTRIGGVYKLKNHKAQTEPVIRSA
jgi:hypothetical protein